MDEDELESGLDSGQMLTRQEVQNKLNDITLSIQRGEGVVPGANPTTALEDSYAYFLNLYGRQINFSDVADFFGGNMTPAQVRAQYLPEGGYNYRDVIDRDAFDFAVPGAPPPLISSRDESDLEEAMAALRASITSETDSPIVASDAPTLTELVSEPLSLPAGDFRTLSPTAGITRISDLQDQGRIASGLFDPINFPARDITRGTPVVTRGLDAQGRPTTAITMGQSTATGSGPNIGQLETFAQFPSTGMGINPDGTGTATVGTLDTTGNIVATGADAVNIFDDGSGQASTVDPNVLNIGTGVGGTNTLGTTAANTIPVQPTPPTEPLTGALVSPTRPTVDPVQPTDPLGDEIRNIFRTSVSKDAASQRIGDLAVRSGGLTAQQLADAVQPLVAAGERPGFEITAPVTAEEVLAVSDQFGYGTGPQGGQFINPTAAEAPGSPSFAPASEEITKFFDDPTRAIGTGDYTSQEAAGRALDFARSQGMSLAEAASAFGLTEEQARERAVELGLNLGTFGFASGGPVTEPPDAYKKFTMSVSMGPDEIAMQRRQQGVQNLMNRRVGVMPSEKMLSKLDRIMGRNDG